MTRRFCLAVGALLFLGCEAQSPPPVASTAPPPPSVPAAADPAEGTVEAASTPAAEPPPPQRATAAGIAYVERVLGGADPQAKLPLIIAIHGLGDDPDNFAHLFDSYPEGARLILPQGLDATENGGWSWFPIRARSNDVEALAAGIKAAADKLAPMIAELNASRPTRGAPIVTGFSQGGMLTFTLAIHHPEVVGAAVAVGGWLPPPLWPDTGPTDQHPNVLALHGTADNAVLFGPTQDAVKALQAKGYDVTLTAFEGVRHAIPPQVRTALFDGLTHAAHTKPARSKADTP